MDDQKWRLNNLYYIQDSKGRRVLFKMNKAQEEFFDNLHFKNIILKARQLGFSTLIQLFMLDMALFFPDTSCGVIAQTLRDATTLFRTKVLFAYDNLPDWLKDEVKPEFRTKSELILSNGSSILVGTSLRSNTYQFLHLSEFGKISARMPERAEEIVSGALNTQEPSGWAFIESTAEGKGGRFYEFCARARELADQGIDLGEEGMEMDWKFNFYPWFDDPKYTLNSKSVELSVEDHKYFAQLGVNLSDGQKAWWVKKNADMKDKMFREFPGSPDEAFSAPLKGSYYGALMAEAEKAGRITDVPYDPRVKVETWWDIGHHDHTSIWFAQRHPSGKIAVIDFYQANQQTLPHFAQEILSKPYSYSRHIGPHDSGNTEWTGTGIGRSEVAETMGLRPWIVTQRTASLEEAIDATMDIIPLCYFDKTKCATGITALLSYTRKFDKQTGVFTTKPLHDKYSDAADAFRTGATAPADAGVFDFDADIKVPKFGAV